MYSSDSNGLLVVRIVVTERGVDGALAEQPPEEVVDSRLVHMLAAEYPI